MINTRLLKTLDMASYILVLFTVLLVPLLLSKSLVNYYVLPKQYIFIGLVLINLLIMAAKMAVSRQFNFRQSILDIPLLILLVIALLSSFFSESLYNSFLGRNEYFLLSFVFLLFLVLFYFVFVNSVDNRAKWKTVVDLLIALGGLISLIFILKTVFAVSLPLVGDVWNLVSGSNTAFAVWLMVPMILSAGQLMKKQLNIGQTIFYLVTFTLNVIVLMVVGFVVLWWIFAIGMFMLLLLGASFIRQIKVGWLSFLFAVLMMGVVFIFLGSPKALQNKLPVEFSLGAKPSWSITTQTVFSGPKNFLVGSGLGSFATDFSKFRTAEFNYDKLIWSLRFNHPFGTYMALLAEGGLVFSLGLLFILFLVLGHVFSSFFGGRYARGLDPSAAAASNRDINLSTQHLENEASFELYIVVVAWLTMWVGMVVAFFDVSLWFTWWLLLGLIMTGLYLTGHRVAKERSWTLEDTPQYNLAFSFSLIVVMAVVVMFGVFGARFYLAEINYTKALRSTDYQTADKYLQKSLNLRGNYDVYHVALARSYLNQASKLASNKTPDVQSITTAVASAVNQARLATQLSPNTVGTWENLSVMYENASLLVPEAGSWAIKSLKTAADLEPTNAFLHWRLANNYMLAKDIDNATKSYQTAISLKDDFGQAYVGLARAYENSNKLSQAISTYEDLVKKGGRDVEVLYHYARLLYNRGNSADKKTAEQLWLNLVKTQPKYSNALYSLGLLYESEGDYISALKYYNKVKELNPDNKDIVKKIDSLTGFNKPVVEAVVEPVVVEEKITTSTETNI